MEADGPPIPVEVTDTFSPQSVPVYVTYSRLSAIRTGSSKYEEIEKTGAQAVRLAWDNVAFVRKFEEAICFFSKEVTRIVIAVPAEHEQEIYDYMDDNSIDVPRY